MSNDSAQSVEGDAACRICRRPEYEHRGRSGHGYVIPPAGTDA